MGIKQKMKNNKPRRLKYIMQDAYKSIHTPKGLRDLFDETVSFQVAASFDANAVCTTAYKSTVSGRIE